MPLHQVYLALGSNLGDRQANLQAAIQCMPPQVNPTQYSPVYETSPWGIQDQPDFLNQVLLAVTELAPLDLLAHLKAIENSLGRIQSIRYGPRLIDLDILLYDAEVINLSGLEIPHPRLHERAFVLVPLADLAPEVRHPVSGLTVRELLTRLDRQGVTPYFD